MAHNVIKKNWLILVTILLLLGCNENRNKLRNDVSFEEVDGYFVRIERYSNGRMKKKSTLTLDTVPIKEQIGYYDNGNIKKWIWYNIVDEYPLFGSYYNYNGEFDSIRGNPFIQAPKTLSGKISLEIVNPPNVYSLVKYLDYFNDTLYRRIVYEPYKTDTSQWVTLDEHIYDSSHKYFIIFYLADKLNRTKEDSITIELD